MKKQFLLASLLLAITPFFIMCGNDSGDGSGDDKDKNTKSTNVDCDFEKWKHYQPGPSDANQYESYYDIDSTAYTTLNFLSTLPPELFPCPQTVYRDSGRNGGYAAKLVSNSGNVGLGGSDLTRIFLPGVVGTIDVIIEQITAKFGRPYTQKSKTLTCWYKYFPVQGDSASIEVTLSKTIDGQKEDIARSKETIKGKVPEWTKLELTIDYINEVVPDSITVLFVSSAGYNFENLFGCKGQEGSTLWIDDVQFSE